MASTRTLILIVALTIMAASCSPKGETSQVATLATGQGAVSETTVTTGDPLVDAEAAMLEFTRCLRDQGIDIGDPTVGPDGSLQLPPIEFTVEGDGSEGGEPDFSAFEEMMAPCEELLSGVGPLGSITDASEFEDTLVEYTQCMRDNGVDMPDPDFRGNGGVIDLGSGATDEAGFEAADAICRSLFESFSSGG
jgi:hypothetical protein